jgi:hypothetical protein
VARSDSYRRSARTCGECKSRSERGGVSQGNPFVNDGLNIYQQQLRPHPRSISNRDSTHKTDDSIRNLAPKLEDVTTSRSVESRNMI